MIILIKRSKSVASCLICFWEQDSPGARSITLRKVSSFNTSRPMKKDLIKTIDVVAEKTTQIPFS